MSPTKSKPKPTGPANKSGSRPIIPAKPEVGKKAKPGADQDETTKPSPVNPAELEVQEKELRANLSAEGTQYLDAVSEYYRHVFLTWLNNGFNKTKAAWAVRPHQTYGTARWMGWCIINNEHIMRIRAELAHRDHRSMEELRYRAIGVELAALAAVDELGNPDHEMRLRAAKQIRMFELKMAPWINVRLSKGGTTQMPGDDGEAPSPIDDLLNMRRPKVESKPNA